MLTEIALDQFLMDGILLKLTVQAKRLAKNLSAITSFRQYNEALHLKKTSENRRFTRVLGKSAMDELIVP